MDAVKQREEAMKKANIYRKAVSVKRKEIAAMPADKGHRELADLIEHCEDPALLSGRVSHWLTAPRFSGHQKATRAIAHMNIRRADHRLRDLTPRQREELAGIVRARFDIRQWKAAA
jgi:hypothetical protein